MTYAEIMPELPEVETTKRGLLKAVKGRNILSVTLRRQDIRTPIPMRFGGDVKGARMLDIRRRAKYLLIDLDTDDVILAHLGMSGSFTVVKTKGFVAKTHDHVIFTLEGGLTMVFNDPRRFGVIDLMRRIEEKKHPLLAHLGPEPLLREFNPTYLKTQLLRRKGAIKPVIMDQKLVVGVGNIYASESLYLCGIHPETPAYLVTPKAAALIDAIRTTLTAAIASGGSTLRNYVGATNEAGYFQHHFHVYDHDGEACSICGSLIQSSVQAGRATYWCSTCQPKLRKRLKT